MLIDHTKIYVSGGIGGKGCQSLYKDIFNRRGTLDGGDGGPGGDVIIKSNSNLHTLLDYRYNQHQRAENGKHGGSNKKYGKKGKDVVLDVPIGTLITDADTGLVLRDLPCNGIQVIVAKGGVGGKGSAKVEIATPGELGEIKTLLLDLKLVADAGIIGFPNAGKSTLVSCISKSHSKSAPYPFTTKSPRLGVVKFYDNTFVAADMPGLIEGAHSGKGLGDRFLRHIERTVVLVHVVDMMPPEGSDPVENYLKLEEELKLYDEKVYNKPRVVVANKIDIPEAFARVKCFSEGINKKVYAISALNKEGLSELIAAVYKEIKNVREKTEEDNT
ncbi:MAG: GTPase ObgE [Candidatus Omnitrophica bacterium]|nr:GTPase ObgE [Candidatus Omnitrophota bacterium]